MGLGQIKSLLDALPSPALFIDLDEHIVAANMPSIAILGEGLLGRNYITALRQPDVLEAVESCINERAPKKARYLGSDNGSDTSYDLDFSFVASDLQGVIVVFTDITDREKIDQVRSDFVANVSHELRTPLTAVIGFIETLQTSAKDDPVAQERFLGIMADETARMNRLVDDLLSLSRVEAQARRRPTQRIDLNALLGSVVLALGPLAKANASLLALAQDAQEVSIPGDSDQLRQVLVNLIENALKYGGQGVEVHVRLQAPAFEPRLRCEAVRISIRDTGAGFDPIHIPRLTERFYRIDSHRSREMGGTGLGLAIAKHVINRHRGRLEVQSTLGQGSEFTVILPIERI
ncbi:MAG: ATP-binding protein [Planktotalea sp.]|uniref:ATP-binding protein n=1 Tax=Planktotalea sp. TaxID=2029877 RepID=UPI003C794A0C